MPPPDPIDPLTLWSRRHGRTVGLLALHLRPGDDPDPDAAVWSGLLGELARRRDALTAAVQSVPHAA